MNTENQPRSSLKFFGTCKEHCKQKLTQCDIPLSQNMTVLVLQPFQNPVQSISIVPWFIRQHWSRGHENGSLEPHQTHSNVACEGWITKIGHPVKVVVNGVVNWIAMSRFSPVTLYTVVIEVFQCIVKNHMGDIRII